MNTPPILEIDPYDVQAVVDPYRYHEALRRHAVVYLPQYDVYATGRHAECAIALTEHARFTTTAGSGIGDARVPGPHARPRNPLLEVDPPDHTALRHVVNKALSPAAVRGWRDQMTRAAVQLVATLPQHADIDLVDGVVEPFVHDVFVRAIGIRFDREAIRAIGNLNGNQTGPQNRLFADAMRRAAPFLTWFEESQQREHVVPGGIAEQFFLLEDAGEMPSGTASTMTRTMVRGGTDSTIAGIGSTLFHLARTAAHWQTLRAEPSRARALFEEGIRLETPFQMSYRLTRGDTELGGLTLAADKKIGVFMGAANRDPLRWADPDRFDPNRATQGHLGFGVSAHNCIGQMLARLEAECLITALAARFARVEVADGPVWRPINQVRTLERLSVQFSE